jgi:acyl transferase domain-containing protein/acyl carrier protein
MISRVAEIAGVPAQDVDPAAPFDTYGLGSAQAISLSGELEDRLGTTLSPTLLYEYPTIDELADALTGPVLVNTGLVNTGLVNTGLANTGLAAAPELVSALSADDDTLCLTGMACRFPGGADTPSLFWQNLVNGVDASSPLPDDRWGAVLPLSDDPDEPGAVYTTRGAFVRDIAGFDARFFGISPREAARMDPQQRLLLEVTWEALENAGIAADQLRGSRTGVFIGMMAGSQYGNLQSDAQGRSCLDDPYFGLGLSASVASGRISYLYDLRGPSLTLDTACSSSLVALHLAAQSIRNGDCDTAVVGGVSAITHPDLFQLGCKMRMLARDGSCKTFDAAADGFAMGEGCGVVILERAGRAAELGHRPLAILRGSATNQDGASNGLTAPSGAAQVAVITRALARAGLRPADLDYVEAHGSGTALGDAIEVGAIQQALGSGRDASRPVIVGAVKTNVGHLTGAAGIAGLIKTVLALRHRQVPANLHLTTPNPGIDWAAAPTLLPAATMPWPEAGTGIAGVSSFGWSGTNAHVILERPARDELARPTPGDWHLLPLSAAGSSAVSSVAGNLAEHLREHPETSVADAACTLQSGRSALRARAAVVCRNAGDAILELAEVGGRVPVRTVPVGHRPRVSFLLPGTGEQYPGMADGLYRAEPAFRAAVDRCAAAASVHGVNLAKAFGALDSPAAPGSVTRLDEAHASVFAADYASASLWRHWGVEPSALLGYSLGEYVAACLAGVFSLEDAIGLVIRRARLVMEAPEGAMTAVALPADETSPLLPADVSVAALNGPMTTVVAGPATSMAGLERELGAKGIAHQRLRTDRAMHSAMLEPLRDKVAALVSEVRRDAPRMPLASNLTGTWITAEQACDPAYWADHMCGAVRFADNVGTLMAEGGILLETGPGNLRSLAAQILAARGEQPVVAATLRTAADPADDQGFILRAAGTLWTHGVPLDWRAMRGGQPGRVTSLPTYPFEHQRFWPAIVAPAVPAENLAPSAQRQPAPAESGPAAGGGRRLPVDAWLNAVQWQPQEAAAGMPVGPFLLLADSLGVAERLAGQLAEFGPCAIVAEGASFADNGGGRFAVRPDSQADYAALVERLAAAGQLPRTVVHLWSLTGDQPDSLDELSQDTVRLRQRLGFTSLTSLTVALAGRSIDGLRVLVATDRARRVEPGELVAPGKATLVGPCLTLPQEYPAVACRTVDLPAQAVRPDDADGTALAGHLMTELTWPGSDVAIAYRSGRRLVRRHAAVAAPPRADTAGLPLRDGGVYLITGGLGKLGLVFARHIASQVAAPRLVLLSRGGLPARDEWDALLAAADGADSAAGRVRAVLELERLGAAVLPYAADVSDPVAMTTAVEEVHRRFGPVNGVVHGAGVTSASGFAMAAALSDSSVAEHFASKVYGTLVLSDVLAAEPLDFCLLQSSMSAELGGLAFTAYAAANAFLASFPDAIRGDGAAAWRSVCWDAWQSTLEQLSGGIGSALAEHAMTDDEALRALDAAYGTEERLLVVSTADLAARRAKWVTGGDPLADADPLAESAGVEASAPVPALADYERRLAALWCKALGSSEIGRGDNFFELGGNSLIGLQLMNSVQKEFRVAVSVVTLFEAPTVAAMAQYLLPAGEASGSAPAEPRVLSPSGPHAAG